MRIDINDIEDIQIDGVDSNDYPDFCDAFFCYAIWTESSDELTDEQLEWLGEDYPEVLNKMAYESFL
jgi:hypothetical protein